MAPRSTPESPFAPFAPEASDAHAPPSPTSLECIEGCLVGGAVGDALGAAVEFLSLADIEARFGIQGLVDFEPAYGRRGAITDDTQMTLFTAEGLLLGLDYAASQGRFRAKTPVAMGAKKPGNYEAFDELRRQGLVEEHDGDATLALVHGAYVRWLATQGGRPGAWNEHVCQANLSNPWAPQRWLHDVPELGHRRAPGMTCMGSLRVTRVLGRAAANDGRGCGTVMRVAPVGILTHSRFFASRKVSAFRLGCQVSALTHGHGAAIVAGGLFAEVVHGLLGGARLEAAIENALLSLDPAQAGTAPVANLVRKALELAHENQEPTPRHVQTLGEGWTADEALAISLYCALVARDFAHGVLLATNHSGDSDSTASLTGQLLGARDGIAAIPAPWATGVEASPLLHDIASDLFDATLA